MTYQTLILERIDGIAKLTLNRPQSMNAMNAQMRMELDAAVEAITADDSIGVLILTGAGRAFCAGLDLKELPGDMKTVGLYPSSMDKLRNLSIPTIAAVNGYAITGGFELVLNCDIIIASVAAKFADTHARVGMFPGGGMTQILPRLVGSKKAKELSFTGNFVDAEEALRIGLVNRVVPADQLEATALAMARDMQGCDQKLIRKMKRVIDSSDGTPLETAMRVERLECTAHKAAVNPRELEQRRAGVISRGRSQAH